MSTSSAKASHRSLWSSTRSPAASRSAPIRSAAGRAICNRSASGACNTANRRVLITPTDSRSKRPSPGTQISKSSTYTPSEVEHTINGVVVVGRGPSRSTASGICTTPDPVRPHPRTRNAASRTSVMLNREAGSRTLSERTASAARSPLGVGIPPGRDRSGAMYSEHNCCTVAVGD